MRKEFKEELKRAEGRTEQWSAVKRLEVGFEDFIKKLKEVSKGYIAASYRVKVSNFDRFCMEIDKLAGSDLK